MSNENYNNHDGDYNGWFLAYLTGFILVSLVLMRSVSLDPDNGTHAILSLFYKNLVESVIKNGDFSFQKIYDFGVAYLVHYPKLQVFYPPLYHLTTGLVFYNIFGISNLSAALSSITFAALAMCTLYVLVMKIFGSKAALISVVLFSIFPYMLMLAWRAMMEQTTMFFLFLSLLVYVEARNVKGRNGGKNGGKSLNYLVLAAVSVLAALSKQAAFFVFPVYFVHLLYEKKWKYAMVFFAASSVLISPYLFAVWKIGGFGINLAIWERYAYEKFVWYFFFEFPFLFVLIGSFIHYIWKTKDKNKAKSLFGIWFFVFLVGMLLISFKYRYFTYFLIPTFVIAANYLSRLHGKWVMLFILGYFMLSAYIVLPTLTYYPVETVAKEMYEKAPAYSGVAMLSEGDNFYSSALMFYFDKFDAEAVVGGEASKNLFVYRPCTFFGKSATEIAEFMGNNNVFYVVAVPNEQDYSSLEGIKAMLARTRGGYVEIYTIKDFVPNERTEYCNYVCLTEEAVCTSYKTPTEVFSRS